MRAQDRKIRNSLRYKIKMWVYRLEFRDIAIPTKKFCLIMLDFIISGIGFLLLLLLPHLFH